MTGTTEVTLRGVCLRVTYDQEDDCVSLVRVEDAEADGAGTNLLPLLEHLYAHTGDIGRTPYRPFEDVLLEAVEETL